MSDIRDNEPSPSQGLLGAAEFPYTVKIVCDDRDTLVEIFVAEDDGCDDQLIGSGLARRRKGDRRNDDIGVSLALARAFRDASDAYALGAKELLE